MRTLKLATDHVGFLVSLVEPIEEFGIKPNVLVHRTRFDVVVVDPEALVWVADGDVEGEIVVERVVSGEVELRERGVGDVELHDVGADDEPEDEDGDADDDEGGEDEFEDEAEDAAAAALEASAAASAWAVVGFFGRRDGGAVISSVQV